MTDARTRRKDRLTAALIAVSLVALAVVSLVGSPTLWVGWAVLTVVASGAAMVRFNRGRENAD
ncbi:hypothetical protein [Natronococcus jeotgali]|uniref:Uncharacterized protein n=1 Tax=Natronococcus jeotgali DSM 18795 TaxID=1227498 RepID=L9X4E5_9EURY|nr:hypothetical protein [Natronococcus jeotgali]ELY56560.1 hypothetical protein C492_14456 [Natronococcus jeotgali DSM 18795]